MIISHPPETIHLIVNSSTDQISLSCTVEGEGVVYWEKDGVKISDSERSIVPGGNTLVIAPDSIVTTSVGMYRCIASNIVGSVMSSSTSVTVTGKWYYVCVHMHPHRVIFMNVKQGLLSGALGELWYICQNFYALEFYQ